MGHEIHNFISWRLVPRRSIAAGCWSVLLMFGEFSTSFLFSWFCLYFSAPLISILGSICFSAFLNRIHRCDVRKVGIYCVTMLRCWCCWNFGWRLVFMVTSASHALQHNKILCQQIFRGEVMDVQRVSAISIFSKLLKMSFQWMRWCSDIVAWRNSEIHVLRGNAGSSTWCTCALHGTRAEQWEHAELFCFGRGFASHASPGLACSFWRDMTWVMTRSCWSVVVRWSEADRPSSW